MLQVCLIIETGTRTQATPSKRVREEVQRLRNRRDAGEKAMELVQSHSQRILIYSSSPAYCWCALIRVTTWTCTYGEHASHRCWLTTIARSMNTATWQGEAPRCDSKATTSSPAVSSIDVEVSWTHGFAKSLEMYYQFGTIPWFLKFCYYFSVVAHGQKDLIYIMEAQY